MTTHIPYTIDTRTNRFHYYETLWKEIALDLLARYEPQLEGLTLLDYGCGRGETLQLASQLGLKALGTDVDPHCVELASAHGETVVLHPDEPLKQFGEKSFDIVTCFHVLEHVPCPQHTLSALGKIARKYVLLAVPNLSKFNDLLRSSKWLYRANEGHLQSWDHAHFLNLMENHCDLKWIDWGYDTVIIPPLSNLWQKLFGQRATIWLETGLFRRLYPYASHSVIALAQPAANDN